MKFRNLFHLVEDAQEISNLFETVETPEQMASAIERLKKHPTEVMELVQSLKLSTEAVLEDALEPGGALGEGDLPDNLDDVEDGLLDSISSNNEQMGGNEKTPKATEVPKANS